MFGRDIEEKVDMLPIVKSQFSGIYKLENLPKVMTFIEKV